MDLGKNVAPTNLELLISQNSFGIQQTDQSAQKFVKEEQEQGTDISQYNQDQYLG